MDQNALAEMILTKFCHDIAGVVGSVQNGAELLSDSFDDRDFMNKAIDALNQSAKVLSARLRFFRMIFGSSKDSFDVATGGALIKEYIATLNGVKVVCESIDEQDFVVMRIKMILVLIAAETLARGGDISVMSDTVVVKGTNIGLKSEVMAGLMAEESIERNPDNAVGLFLYHFAKQEGYKIIILEKPEAITFSIRSV